MTTAMTRGMPTARHGLNPALLGLTAAVGGILYTIAGLRLTFGNDAFDTTTAVLALPWCLGGLAGLVGIARLGVAGHGTLGRAALIAAFAGFDCALLAWLTGFDDPGAVDDSAVMNVGRVLRLLGFLGLGIATVKTSRWMGWRRLTPFLYPLAVVLGGLSSVALGVELTVTLIVLAWLGIGGIIATSNPDGAGRVSAS
jgi:hypothetical protein